MVRWNNVLAEAGFPPNRLNAAHEEDHLLRQLALLVREFGRYPVEAEIRMRRRTHPDFPSASTFRRFGKKQETINRLSEFSESEPELRDVAVMCAPLVTSEENEDGGGDEPDGSMYLIKTGRHHKIGRSNSAARRFYEVKLQLPEPATLVHYIATDDPAGIERSWHQRFVDRRANGEWFLLTASDIKAFRRRKFM